MASLEEWNRRLQEMQAANRQRRIEQNKPILIDQGGIESTAVSLPERLATLPPHLGWESEAVSRLLRSPQPLPSTSVAAPQIPAETALLAPTINQPQLTIKLYPDIALGVLRQNMAAPGRVYFLLKHLDERGQGWHELGDVRRMLTSANSPHRICGKRHLRNLLAQGEGVFWVRGNGRLWLFGQARVAGGLDVNRLTTRPVSLPVQTLLGDMRHVSAHLLSSFHSGRADGEGMPIARDTLTALSGVSRRTQLEYEKITGTAVRHNYAVGAKIGGEPAQEQCWQHQGSAFTLTDYRGLQGMKGGKYVAWQIPNSYEGPHTRLPQGQRRQINRKIADLMKLGTLGNGDNGIEERRYHKDGKRAIQAFSKNQREHYWRRRSGHWQVINLV